MLVVGRVCVEAKPSGGGGGAGRLSHGKGRRQGLLLSDSALPPSDAEVAKGSKDAKLSEVRLSGSTKVLKEEEMTKREVSYVHAVGCANPYTMKVAGIVRISNRFLLDGKVSLIHQNGDQMFISNALATHLHDLVRGLVRANASIELSQPLTEFTAAKPPPKSVAALRASAAALSSDATSAAVPADNASIPLTIASGAKRARPRSLSVSSRGRLHEETSAGVRTGDHLGRGSHVASSERMPISPLRTNKRRLIQTLSSSSTSQSNSLNDTEHSEPPIKPTGKITDDHHTPPDNSKTVHNPPDCTDGGSVGGGGSLAVIADGSGARRRGKSVGWVDGLADDCLRIALLMGPSTAIAVCVRFSRLIRSARRLIRFIPTKGFPVPPEVIYRALTASPQLLVVDATSCADFSSGTVRQLTMSPRFPRNIEALLLRGCYKLTDAAFKQFLIRIRRLVVLDVLDCSKLSVSAFMSILRFNTVKHLLLGSCASHNPSVPPWVSSAPTRDTSPIDGKILLRCLFGEYIPPAPNKECQDSGSDADSEKERSEQESREEPPSVTNGHSEETKEDDIGHKNDQQDECDAKNSNGDQLLEVPFSDERMASRFDKSDGRRAPVVQTLVLANIPTLRNLSPLGNIAASLLHLDLRGCIGVDDSAAATFRLLTNLRVLSLAETSVGSLVVETVAAKCSRLECLDLGNLHTRDPTLSRTAVAAIAAQPPMTGLYELRKLKITDNRAIDNEGVEFLLAGLVKLEVLDVSQCWNVDDRLLQGAEARIAAKDSLSVVHVKGCSVDTCRLGRRLAELISKVTTDDEETIRLGSAYRTRHHHPATSRNKKGLSSSSSSSSSSSTSSSSTSSSSTSSSSSSVPRLLGDPRNRKNASRSLSQLLKIPTTASSQQQSPSSSSFAKQVTLIDSRESQCVPLPAPRELGARVLEESEERWIRYSALSMAARLRLHQRTYHPA